MLNPAAFCVKNKRLFFAINGDPHRFINGCYCSHTNDILFPLEINICIVKKNNCIFVQIPNKFPFRWYYLHNFAAIG